jgi:hypothetical protein
MHQHGFAGLEPGIVEQHVLHRRERRSARRRHRAANALGHRDHQPCRHVDEIAREAVDVKPMMPPTFSHKIVAALAAGLAGAAGQAPYMTTQSPGMNRPCRARRGDLAGRLDADHDRHLALGKGHAAIAPEIEMIERHRLDADLHLARAGAAGGGMSVSSSLRSARRAESPHASRGLAAHHQRDVLSRRNRTSSTARGAPWHRGRCSARRRAGSPDPAPDKLMVGGRR